MSIAPLVPQCLDHFKKLLALSKDHAGVDDRINDEWGRFRVWVGNVSAHTTGRRSLQYRLRDSEELTSAVIKYLTQLKDELQRAAAYVVGDLDVESPSDGKAAAKEQTVEINEEPGSDYEDGDMELFSSFAEPSDHLQTIEDIITCLLRISMALRNPARNNQIRYADTVSTEHFQTHDIQHVRSKFPEATDPITSRLGVAISRHRQYIRYREAHHFKMMEGINDNEKPEQSQPQDGQTIAKLTSGLATTIATPLPMPMPAQEISTAPESDMESIGTATSYAETMTGDRQLRPPKLPEAGLDARPFECPLCYGIISVDNERSWRQHVYEDLPPYLCLDQQCKAATRQFGRRRDWRQHMSQHKKHWMCPSGCSDIFSTIELFQRHLESTHNELLNGDLAALRVSCARDETSFSKPMQCPLCPVEKPHLNLWYKHVGHHLEQLTLFALPSHVFDDDSNEDAEQLDERELSDSHSRLSSDVVSSPDHDDALPVASESEQEKAVEMLPSAELADPERRLEAGALTGDHPRPLSTQLLTAITLRDKGEVRESIELLERLVAVQSLREESADRLLAQHHLAIAYRKIGQEERSVDLLERVVAGWGRVQGEASPDQLISQHYLALAYYENGQNGEAVELLEQVTAVSKRVLGEAHPTRLESQFALARALEADGQLGYAIVLLKEVVAIREREFVEDHPDLLLSQHGLAVAYLKNRQLDEAQGLLERVATIRERLLPQDHPHLLSTLHALATVYQDNGRRKDSISLLEHVAKTRERTLGEDNPDLIETLQYLATTYLADGQVEEGTRMHERIVASQTRTLGEDHPESLKSQYELVSMYRASGRTKAAIHLLEQVVKVRKQVSGEFHRDVLRLGEQLALTYLEDGQLGSGVYVLEHMLSRWENMAPEKQIERFELQHALGKAFHANGQTNGAVRLLERAAAGSESVLGTSHASTISRQHDLAKAYQANGKVKSAIDLFERVARALEYELGEDDPDLIRTLQSLAELYQANGQKEEAVRQLEHVVAIEERSRPADHPNLQKSRLALAVAYQTSGREVKAKEQLTHIKPIPKEETGMPRPNQFGSPVQAEYEGYMLIPLRARPGEMQTWARVRQQLLPFDDDELQRMASEHRWRARVSPSDVYNELLDHQRGAVDRLIAEKMRDERHPHAVWDLFNLQFLENNHSRYSSDLQHELLDHEDVKSEEDKMKNSENETVSKEDVVCLRVILRRQMKANSDSDDWTTRVSDAARTTAASAASEALP